MLPEKLHKVIRRTSILVVLLAGVCLFFLNRKTTIDWGEDNAAYIIQGNATASWHLQSENKFVYDGQCKGMGPALYPWGFPLALAAVNPFAENNISSYILLMHVMLALGLLLLFFYMRSFLAPAVAALVVLVFAFNPEIVIAKNDIMSDLFFLFLILVFLPAYEKVHTRKTILLLSALLLMFIVNTRVLGLCLVPAIFLYELFLNSSNRKERLYRAVILVFITMIFSVCFSFFISGYGGYRYVADFMHYIKSEWTLKDVLDNVYGYAIYASDYFIPRHETKQWAIIPIRVFTMLSVLTGIWQFIKLKRVTLYSFFIPLYLFAVIIFPSHYIVERYFFPVVPFMLLLMIAGWEFALQKARLNKNLCILFLCAAVAGYYPNLKYLAGNDIEPDGPQTPEAQQAWRGVKQFTNETDTVSFHYPRALILFTNRFGRTLCSGNDYNPPYILNDNSNRKHYDIIYTGKYVLLWKNERFELFKLKMRS